VNEPESDLFGRRYVEALEAYLRAGDEPALSRAYELGRRAMVDGLGVLDMALVHRTAVQAIVVPAASEARARYAAAASDFFQELLSPFEMSFRGYRAANDNLRGLNESLRRQKEALEDVNRELESFSYSVSHDLRAPLRSIDGFSQALAEDCGGALDEQGKRYLGRIRDAAQRMGRLIDDLLSLARVTRSELDRRDVDVSALVRRIAERLQRETPTRTVRFEIQEGVHAVADGRLLEPLFENLLGNAWKFTSRRAEARIAFGHEVRDGLKVFFVKDDGAGFDMAYAGKLFGTFQRLHSEREFEGTGVGLATVQRIVHRHDGRIWAQGEVDRGAEFYFTLEGGRRR
jgi:light-regulated signal transduction histidine kinase (bacteriophytochrome)